jgi:hypothetical protein
MKKKTGKVSAPTEPVDPHNHDWPMTDEDRAMIREGHEYGREHGHKFFDAAKGELLKLITTYSDAEAEALFWQLREKFWARIWVPAQPKSADKEPK